MIYNFLLSTETFSGTEDAMKTITMQNIEHAYGMIRVEEKNLSFREGTRVGIKLIYDPDIPGRNFRIMLALNGRTNSSLQFADSLDPDVFIDEGDVAVDMDVFSKLGRKEGFAVALGAYLSYYAIIKIVYDENAPMLNAVRFELDIAIPRRPLFTTQFSCNVMYMNHLVQLGVEWKTAW